METIECIDVRFAHYLITSLKTMKKENGTPFITNGVTLPFLAYAYKQLNNDTSSVSVDDLLEILKALDKATPNTFVFEVCSEIEERVVALYSETNVGYYDAKKYYLRTAQSYLLCDPDAIKQAQPLEDISIFYKKILDNKTYSRVYKDYHYNWDELSGEEKGAIQTIVELYKK